jgi:hypothetical protein
LVSHNSNPASLSFLAGIGTGSFSPAVNHSIAITPFDLVADDFDNDGMLDLASVNTSTNVSVLLGVGSGSFVSTGTYSVSYNSGFLTSNDFNSDGKKDIAICNYSQKNYSIINSCFTVGFNDIPLNNNEVIIYPNPSNGLFTVDLKDKSEAFVTNALGEFILIQKVSAFSDGIDLRDFEDGIYFLTITNLTSKTQTKRKIVKL